MFVLLKEKIDRKKDVQFNSMNEDALKKKSGLELIIV